MVIVNELTADALVWVPWLVPVDPNRATEPQKAVLAAATSAINPFFLTLLHDPESLAARGLLYRSVMAPETGLPPADREVVAVNVSALNRCIYCVSVHSRAYLELVDGARYLNDLFSGRDAGVHLEERQAALIAFAQNMAGVPPKATVEDIKRLKQAGVSDADTILLIHTVAMFSNANRLMQPLGAATRPDPAATGA
jgi:uncharacterized peroxidase-related enzyme